MLTWSVVLRSVVAEHGELLLGWLLGILSPAIIESIRRHYRVRRLGDALAQELHELQWRMAAMAYLYRQRACQLDDEFLNWLLGIAQAYEGPEPSHSFVEAVPHLLAIPSVKQRSQPPPDKRRGFGISTAEAPLLSIHLNEIALFPIEAQRWLLQVRKQIGFINQVRDDSRRLHERTFDTLSETNRVIVLDALEENYASIAKVAIQIARLVSNAPRQFKLKARRSSTK